MPGIMWSSFSANRKKHKKTQHSQTSERRSATPQQHSLLRLLLRLRFIPLHLSLSRKMLTNLSHHFSNMLHQTTACYTICHVLQHSVNIYLFKPYCSASSHFCKTVRSRALRWLSNPGSTCAFASWELLELSIFSRDRLLLTLCESLTSPHGPGSLTRQAHRWCTVCHRRPGCCVCSEPPSSGTPDSSCPAATCSTTRQPPSRPTLCPLRYTGTRAIEVGRDYEVCQTKKRLN